MHYVAKELHITAPEWRRLPWHDQRAYTETVLEEIKARKEQEKDGGSSTTAGYEDYEEINEQQDPFAGAGFQVREAGQ